MVGIMATGEGDGGDREDDGGDGGGEVYGEGDEVDCEDNDEGDD